ncbi:MAG TPA: M1 family metallopeptidase [Sphingomicrobium sp.]|nr:M1 family metallopeptidase [Sphingomicrobium sp.]
MRSLTAVFAAFALLSCRAGDSPPAIEPVEAAPILDTPDAVDIHSFAKPLEARVTHVALDLNVDFDTRRIGGTATLDVQAKPDATQIILDDKGLEIEAVTDEAGQPLPYKVGAFDEILGAPLTIQMGDTRKIVIRYRSAPDAGALQWLTPEQTAGKKHPFLLSQGQSIENRSWIPTQDSPGIRQTWEAWIAVPSGLTAVMSAKKGDKADPTPPPPNKSSFYFNMDKPVAPYLIAIAVGDLAFRELGPRTGVWTEPAMLDKAAAELSDTEKMIDAAEKLYGPYQWGRYDMLVLPPSFPFGGMENPTLTFLTPTFIAGDKSLTSLIAHELAHSWSGNLATNATWADFWLNEGLTTYAERRIVEAIYGPKVASQQVSLGFDALNKEIAEIGGPNHPDTRLHIDLKGRNPDEGSTDIPYEKGAAFLRTIESIVGRERFDQWLKGWFERHRFQPVTTSIFLADIREHLVSGDAALEQKLQLDRWVNEPGIPDNVAPADPQAFAEVDAAVANFVKLAARPQQWGEWNTDERLRFLNSLPRKLGPSYLHELNRAFGLNDSGNNEVLFAWLELAVANRYEPAVPALERFLTVQGRRKFVRPLITALAEDEQWGRPIAIRIYRKARASYHPMTTRDLDKLGLLQE